MAGSATLRWLAVILMAGGSLAAAEQTRTVRVDIDERGALVIPMVVGNASCRFLLDTGATTSIVTDRLTRRLGLDPIATSVVGSSSGADRSAPVVALPSVVLGGFARESLRALVLPQATLDAAAPGVDGVLAEDLLNGLNYTLDYRRRRFTWDGPQDGGTDTRGRRALNARGRAVRGGHRSPRLDQTAAPRPRHRQRRAGAVRGRAVGPARADDRARDGLRCHPIVDGGGDAAAGARRSGRRRTQSERVDDRREAARRGRRLLPLHVFDSVSFAGDGAYLVVR